MKVIATVIFWVAVCWIALCVLILLMGRLLPVQFSSESAAQTANGLVWLTCPVAILATLVRTNKERPNRVRRNLTIFVAVVSFLFLSLFTFGNSMCGYTTDAVLFTNRFDSNAKIVTKHYGCGAYDSDKPRYEVYQIKPLNNQFVYSKQIDTLKVNRTKWIRNKN